MKKLRIAVIAALFAFMVVNTGCTRLGARILARTIVTAAVVATVLAYHDAHYHHHHCGHRMVIVERREVYHYQDRWEYYDADGGRWYYYEDLDVH